MVSRRTQSHRQTGQAVDLYGARGSRLHRCLPHYYRRSARRRRSALRALCSATFAWGAAMKTVGNLVYQFFEHHLKAEKGLAQTSIRSYRDGIRLFLLFLARKNRRPVSKLGLTDLSADNVRAFLAHRNPQSALAPGGTWIAMAARRITIS